MTTLAVPLVGDDKDHISATPMVELVTLLTRVIASPPYVIDDMVAPFCVELATRSLTPVPDGAVWENVRVEPESMTPLLVVDIVGSTAETAGHTPSSTYPPAPDPVPAPPMMEIDPPATESPDPHGPVIV